MLDTDTPRKGEPMRHPETEQLLTELGIEFEAPTMTPIEDINLDGSRKAQIRDTALDVDAVDRYVDFLNNADRELPAVVGRATTNSGLLIAAGLHRLESYILAARTHVPLYRIRCTDQQAYELSVRSNTSHGVPLTRDERVRGAVHMITRHGVTHADAATKVGVSVATVNRGMAEIRGKTRARRHRQEHNWAKIQTLGARMAVASIGSDEVFADAVEVAARLGLTASQAEDLAERINARSTPSEMHEALDQFEMELDAGSGRPATKKSTEVTEAATARRHLFELDDIDVDTVVAGCQADQTETTANMARSVAGKLLDLADRLDLEAAST